MTTPDIAGLCERLRETRSVWSEAKEASIKRRRNPDGPEAADTLERQAAELVEARTLDKGFSEWMIERDLLARGEEVEWGDIVTALTEHEIELTGDDRLVKRQAAEIERLRSDVDFAVSCLCSLRKNYADGLGIWDDVDKAISARAALTERNKSDVV
jgi:hypothetical protein